MKTSNNIIPFKIFVLKKEELNLTNDSFDFENSDFSNSLQNVKTGDVYGITYNNKYIYNGNIKYFKEAEKIKNKNITKNVENVFYNYNKNIFYNSTLKYNFNNSDKFEISKKISTLMTFSPSTKYYYSSNKTYSRDLGYFDLGNYNKFIITDDIVKSKFRKSNYTDDYTLYYNSKIKYNKNNLYSITAKNKINNLLKLNSLEYTDIKYNGEIKYNKNIIFKKDYSEKLNYKESYKEYFDYSVEDLIKLNINNKTNDCYQLTYNGQNLYNGSEYFITNEYDDYSTKLKRTITRKYNIFNSLLYGYDDNIDRFYYQETDFKYNTDDYYSYIIEI